MYKMLAYILRKKWTIVSAALLTFLEAIVPLKIKKEEDCFT